ncbi:MAG: hypothetical protein ACK4GW_07930 [Pseudorhodobacter sp.]
MTKKTDNTVDLSRRRLMIRAGLVAGTAYMAPALAGLNAAHASGNSGGGSRGGNSGASKGGRSAPSRGSSPAKGRSVPSGRTQRRSVPSGRAAKRSSGRSNRTPGWVRQVFGG